MNLEELLALHTPTGQNIPPPPPVCSDGKYPQWVNGAWVCGSLHIKTGKAKPGINQALGEEPDGLASPDCSCGLNNGAAAPGWNQNQMTTMDPQNMNMFNPNSACAVFRGWGDGGPVSTNTSPCEAGGCNPGTPRGLWAIPGTITVPAGAPGTFVLDLTTPRPANLWAMVVQRVTGASITAQSVTAWLTAQVNTTYPQWGTGTTAPNPDTAVMPAQAYGAESVSPEFRQNVLPPWVPKYNTMQTNAVLRCTLRNADAVNAAVWDILFIMNYGR